MARERLTISAVALSCLWIAGCGADPSRQPENQASVDRSARPASKPKAEKKPAAEKPAEPQPAETEEQPNNDPFRLERTPKDIVTAGDTAFVFNFKASEVGSKAEAKCDEQAAGDMKKRAECLSTRQKKFGTKILRFVNKGKGEKEDWWWVTYDRRGSQLVTLHKLKFEFGPETKSTIAILPRGKDKGLAPMGHVPRKVEITVPNEYSIELNDPVHGRLVYEAKIGIVGT
jgi:outer membrane murein-binding lipoprotein Lpp